MSAARPKIADYPFTTLIPNLGVVQAGEVRFTIADVPGLIEGASEGKGLGHHFLRHVERCAALVHVLDCGTLESDRDPLSDLAIIEAELEKYAVDMSYSGSDGEVVPLNHRPRLVALNKVDLPDGKDMAEFVRPELESRGYKVFEISATSHEGLRQLGFAMAEIVQAARDAVAATPPKVQAPVLRPRAVNETGFTIRREEKNLEPLFRVLGDKPVRWVKQTDFTNEEAIGYLADRLAKLGVENELFKQGATAGRHGGHRRGRRRRLRLGADHDGRRRTARLAARHRRALRRHRRPPDPRTEARRTAGTPRRQGRRPRRARSRAQGRHLDRVRQRTPGAAAAQGEWTGRSR